MIDKSLQSLGDKLTRLRIAKNLKQSELAYEAGISERTLQRMEAGEVVKSDGLLKVIAYLGKLDGMLEAIDPPKLSPYELVTRAGKGRGPENSGAAIDERMRPKRARVRTGNRTKAQVRTPKQSIPAPNNPSEIVWPEDQA